MGTLTQRLVREKIAPRHSPANRMRSLMKRRHRSLTRLFAALLTVVGALLGATVAAGEGGGQNQFPCTSTTIRAGALLPELVPDQQLLADDHVVWRDLQTGQFLLAFSAGIKNLGAGSLNAVGYRDRIAGTGSLPNPNTMPAYQRIFHADGSCDELRIGTLTYHDIHHHWHLDGVMTYQLLDANLKRSTSSGKPSMLPESSSSRTTPTTPPASG